MFGVIPKEGNLTQGDIKEAQMFINNNVQTIASILPKYDKVTVKINPKTGKPSVIKSIGMPRKLVKLFYTKSEKKIGNDYRWTRNETIDINKLLKHVGITERTKPNLYKKDTNTSQSVIGLMNLVGRMMTNQASREYFLDNNMPLENMGLLQESIGTAMFSKTVNEGSLSDKAIFFAGLPKFGENYYKSGMNVKKTFDMTYPPNLFENNIDNVIRDLERYIELYEAYELDETIAQGEIRSLDEYINERTMQLELEQNLRDMFDLSKDKLNFRSKEQLEKLISDVTTILYEGGFTQGQAKRFLSFTYSTGKIGGTTLTMDENGKLISNPDFWNNKIKD